jgi:hypothetical protein
MTYRTSQPLHPTEGGKPKRKTVTKKKQVLVDKSFSPPLRGSVETRTKQINRKAGSKRRITKTKERVINAAKDGAEYRNYEFPKRHVVKKSKVTRDQFGQGHIKKKTSVRKKGKMAPQHTTKDKYRGARGIARGRRKVLGKE